MARMLLKISNFALLLLVLLHANVPVHGNIEVFKIKDRNTGRNVVAELKDGVWEGELNIVPLHGRRSSLMAEVRCNGVDANFDRDLVPIQSLNVTIASSEDPPILTTGLFQDHVHLYAERAGTAKVAFSWESPAGSDSPQCTTPPIDVRVPNVETFEILDRGQDRKKIAYAHGDHWHYSDGPPEVGSGSARGSYSANVKCDGKEPDYGAGDSLHVELGNGQPEFVETESHGDHVHIRATDNGQTKVVFSWMHNDRVECSVPEMTINARMGDVNGPSPEPSPSPSPSPGPPTPSNDARTVGGLATFLILQVVAVTWILSLV